MSDFLRGSRPSLNVQTDRPDRVRQNWLETMAYAPDAYRSAHGLSQITDDVRGAAQTQLYDESPYIPQSYDWFDQGRPVQLPKEEGLAALGQPSFRQRNDDALLGQSVAGMLGGQAQPTSDFESVLQGLMGRGLPALGRR